VKGGRYAGFVPPFVPDRRGGVSVMRLRRPSRVVQYGMAELRPADGATWEERVARVRQALCDTIVPFDLRVSRDTDCLAAVHSVDMGVVRMVCFPGGPVDAEVMRTPHLIRRSDPDLCKIDLQLRGRSVLEQDDQQAELSPGDFTFIDLSRPCQLAGRVDGVVAVMFPRSLLPLRYQETRQLAGVSFRAEEANSALVTALVGQVVSRFDAYPGAGGERIGAAIFDLITAALSVRLDRADAISPDARLSTLTWRVKTFIEERLGDPDLSPGEIAAAHHVSLRYLHRIFEREATTVGGWIRARRLDRCQRDLTDPALVGRPVSAIGARWGYLDATHFSRAFKARYGLTPAEYRRVVSGRPRYRPDPTVRAQSRAVTGCPPRNGPARPGTRGIRPRSPRTRPAALAGPPACAAGHRAPAAGTA
jgi:AraC-like DNA-binding protein